MKRIVSEASKKKAKVYKSSLNLQQSSKEPEGSLQLASSESIQYDVAETFTGKQLRYAKRKTPEERKKDKLATFNDISGSDDDYTSTQQPVRKKKMSAKESALEAQTAHTKMCAQASTTLNLMTGILQKLDKKIDDNYGTSFDIVTVYNLEIWTRIDF